MGFKGFTSDALFSIIFANVKVALEIVVGNFRKTCNAIAPEIHNCMCSGLLFSGFMS